MVMSRKEIEENGSPAGSVTKVPKGNELKRKVPKALMGDSKEICRPHYYGIYTNAAQINGARKKPHLLFSELDKETQAQYEALARKLNVSETVSMYNIHGEQIILDKTKRFIIMVLLEMYNEQVVNNTDFNDPNFMMNNGGYYGRVYTSAYTLACRIYNTKTPGNRTNVILKHLRQLAGIPAFKDDDVGKWRGMLVYDAPNRETGEIETTFMYDNLISLGCVAGKRGAFGFIKLHEAFFANIRNFYIHSFPTSSKLTDYYNNKIPPQAAITLDQKLKQAGSLGNKMLKMYASLLYDTLAHERFIVRDYGACKKITEDVIEACKFTGILEDSEETTGSTGEKLYILKINLNFFPRKDENKGASNYDKKMSKALKNTTKK